MLGGQTKVAGGSGSQGYPTTAEGWSNSATRCRTPGEGHSNQQATERATNTEGKKLGEDICYMN